MAQSNLWKFLDECDLNGSTLIIPSVAVGNVGQLACDLLVSTLEMKRVASVHSSAFIPVLGYDPYNLSSENASTSCELYKSMDKNILVLQLRSPLIYKHARDFLKDVVQVLKKRGVVELIVLTSSYGYAKKHIQTSPFRYLVSESCSLKRIVEESNWTLHNPAEDGVHVFGGGFATLLYDIGKEENLPCLLLYKYCSEGDNIPDAHEMILHLASVLPLFDNFDDKSKLVQPMSWKLLFGSPPPLEIY